MNLLRDLLHTANDAIRLCSDVMRYKIEKETKAVKRGASRIGIYLGVGLIALGFIGAGIGLLLYGAFAMVADALGPGPSGLIIGAASMLFAGLLILLICGSLSRS
jgi:hypothetical protein